MASTDQNKDLFIKIEKLINSSRINESFLLLKKNLSLYPNLSWIIEKLNQEESTYKYMLDYLADGFSDPSQKEVINQIKESLHQANDALLRESKMKDSSDIYSSSKRIYVLRNSSFKLLLDNFIEAQKKNENESLEVISPLQNKNINEIFNYVWTLGPGEKEELNVINSFLEDKTLPEYLKALIISALTLGNLSYFNPDSYEVLLNVYENFDSTTLRARALVAVVLIALLHSERIAGNLNLRSRLLLTSEDDYFKENVNNVLFNIIKTFDTKRIDNKMRNEVIPGLMKIKPEIIDKMRNLASDSDNFLSDENPQWEELIENSDFSDKLKEINDMQLEGADVMVTAFSNLKGFPFFSLISNWFIPFSPGHYEFAQFNLDWDKENINRLTTVMCDSDLHSFLLSLGTMPADKRDLMLSNMQRQMKEAYKALQNSIGETEEQKLAKKIRHSLQDLYRFFKFFRKKDDFKDPFAEPFLGADIEILLPILGLSIDNIQAIGEFYFKNKYYKEAAGFLELTDKEKQGDYTVWEKIGYCYDRLKLFDLALEWYSKSDLVNPGNLWLEKKMAITLKTIGKAEEALKYYNKALEKEPENYHLIMSAGESLLLLGRYKDALNHFYHAQYLKPEKKDALRAVAWAELIDGNFEKSKSHYEKLLSGEAEKSDYLNYAHGALANGDFKTALKNYKLFLDNSENKDITSLVIAFREDTDIIKKLGIKNSDLRLIVDKIRYDLIS